MACSCLVDWLFSGSDPVAGCYNGCDWRYDYNKREFINFSVSARDYNRNHFEMVKQFKAESLYGGGVR
jgi:hypothetical protein